MNINIDLFSDTNVNPCKAMRHQMANATVGNEVAGEDPSINALLEKVCEVLNKPAATFMPSGSMCNSTGLRALSQPGNRIILEKSAHALNMTAGMLGGLAGVLPEVINGQRGLFTSEQLKKAIGKNNGYNIAKASVVAVEQTTNFGGGAIWPLNQLNELTQCAHSFGLKTHMDGARLFNASIATGISPAHYAADFDSVWIDFAKGLGAPMGAVIAGEQDFIDKVWYFKFQQGGGMHQAGIMAAACLYALEHHVERLAEDHENAKLLATLLANINGIVIEPNHVETNIVIFELNKPTITAQQLVDELLKSGIRLLAIDHAHLRAIVHMDIDQKAIHQVAHAIEKILNVNTG